MFKKNQGEWEENIEAIRSIQVVALVCRFREDITDQKFQVACKGEQWLVPIVEIIC